MLNLYGQSRSQLEALFVEHGLQEFRGRQLLKWIYHLEQHDFASMTDLPKTMREWLAANACFDLPQIVRQRVSKDGTAKWALDVGDGNLIETVLIPEKGRNTLCVSSQVGCMLDCSFCSTGKQGFNGNLPTATIVGQLVIANRYLAQFDQKVTNIVLMGMGEPLLNFSQVLPAVSLMMDDLAFGLSKRRVTVSTAGVVPGIYDLAEQSACALAISLHAPTDDLRDQLVPVNRKYPIAQLMEACQHYVDHLGKSRSLVIEYTLIKGINDSRKQARQLAELLRPLRCKINLIPFNPFPGSGYEKPSAKTIYDFQTCLMQAGYTTMLRTTRGEDIDAACGQLVGQVADRTRRQQRYHAKLEAAGLERVQVLDVAH